MEMRARTSQGELRNATLNILIRKNGQEHSQTVKTGPQGEFKLGKECEGAQICCSSPSHRAAGQQGQHQQGGHHQNPQQPQQPPHQQNKWVAAREGATLHVDENC